jgi:hypothetical protein
MQLQRARVLACFAVFIALVLESRAGDSSMPTFVPWKVLNPGDETLKTDLVLFWIPSSRDEIRRSPLLTSRPLAIYSTQCVGMQIVRPDDDETIEKLGASGHLPMAVLAGADGAILASLGGAAMRLIAREAGADRLLDDAREKAESGDREAAITLYRRVCAQRCLLPRKARDAQKALHRMGEE